MNHKTLFSISQDDKTLHIDYEPYRSYLQTGIIDHFEEMSIVQMSKFLVDVICHFDRHGRNCITSNYESL